MKTFKVAALAAFSTLALLASPALPAPSFPPGAGGGVSNVATGACLTGGPITSTGTISGSYVGRAIITTSDTVLSSDACKILTYANASAIAAAIPQATGSFGAGFSFDVENVGVGTVTFTPTTSTINGAATFLVPSNTGCTFWSDGTNWQIAACTAVAGKFLLTNATGLPPAGVTSVQGNGAKFQLSTGSTTTNNCVKYDANGNTVDAGTTCGGGGGSGFTQKYVSGNTYWALSAVLLTGGAPTIGKIYFTPVAINGSFSIASLGVDIATSGAGNFQACLYAGDATTGLPTGAALSCTSSISTGSAFGQSGALSAAQAVTPGLYWIAVMADNTTVRFASIALGNTGSTAPIGTNASGQGAGLTTYIGPTVTFGSWPTMNGTACGSGNCTTVAGTSSNGVGPDPFYIVQ